MNTTTPEKTTDPPSMSDCIYDIERTSIDLERGAQILTAVSDDLLCGDEGDRVKYLARQIERHVKDLDQAVLNAYRALVRKEGEVQKAQATSTTEPTPSTSTTASADARSYLFDLEDPIADLQGLAQTILHTAQTASMIEPPCLSFLGIQCHNVWKDLRARWEHSWEAAGGTPDPEVTT